MLKIYDGSFFLFSFRLHFLVSLPCTATDDLLLPPSDTGTHGSRSFCCCLLFSNILDNWPFLEVG